jgi:hypothetical protein
VFNVSTTISTLLSNKGNAYVIEERQTLKNDKFIDYRRQWGGPQVRKHL